MQRLYEYLSFPQPSQLLLNHGNLGFGVGFLLAFLIDHGIGSVAAEVFIGNFMACFEEVCSQICEHSKILSIFAASNDKT